MPERVVRFGVVGGGLMGREFASAAARWIHLADIGVRPELVAVCDTSPEVLSWYERLRPAPRLVADYRELLSDDSVDAVYCAVPHRLHEEIYVAALEAGKHLLGEKPFGIDLAANDAINRAIAARPELHVSCSSELPFYPGGQEVARFVRERRFGRVLEVRSLFLHSSDLDPNKASNWKRIAEWNGEYGCMGDLGMHALHLPLRAGWEPRNVRAILSNVVAERPGPGGEPVPCDTWDNAVLLCEAEDEGRPFPLRIETKRIAPGETTVVDNVSDGLRSAGTDIVLAKILFLFLGIPGVLLAASAGRHAGHHAGAHELHLLGVERALATGDALDQHLRRLGQKDRHLARHRHDLLRGLPGVGAWLDPVLLQDLASLLLVGPAQADDQR